MESRSFDMTIKVVVRKSDKGYRAVVPGFSDCAVEATTREDAIEQVKDVARALLTKAAELNFEVIEAPEVRKRTKLSDYFGMWKDDETWDEFQAAIQAYRREVDSRSE
jgi:predicted RNase H-like HicB family nuclease